MQTQPAKRCQHIFTKGTQCGSPALRNKRFCYYHEQCPPCDTETYGKQEYALGEITLPPFEDAHSIQFVLRQVTQLLLQKRIDHKTAGLLLYSLQIASANLKRLGDEQPQPSDVVVDLEKVPDTPLESASPVTWESLLGLGDDDSDDSEEDLPPGTIQACAKSTGHLQRTHTRDRRIPPLARIC